MSKLCEWLDQEQEAAPKADVATATNYWGEWTYRPYCPYCNPRRCPCCGRIIDDAYWWPNSTSGPIWCKTSTGAPVAKTVGCACHTS